MLRLAEQWYEGGTEVHGFEEAWQEWVLRTAQMRNRDKCAKTLPTGSRRYGRLGNLRYGEAARWDSAPYLKRDIVLPTEAVCGTMGKSVCTWSS